MKRKVHGASQHKASHAMSEFDNPRNKPSMGKGSTNYPPAKKVEEAGHELKVNPPSVLKSTAKKFGKKAAQRQRVAIMLNKARKGG